MCKTIAPVVALLVLLGFSAVESCSPVAFVEQEDPKRQQQREEDLIGHQLVNVVVQSRLGKETELKAYDNKHYITRNGGPVDSGDELSCDFESPCCWSNSEAQLDWNVVEESVDSRTFEETFRTADRPSGHFLLATSAVTKPKLRAEFVSCDVLCTERGAQISFRHWTTTNVKLELCTENALVVNKKRKPDQHCQEIPSKSSPGPTIIKLPPGDYFVIKFVASNFVDKGGGVAILDDIVVTAPSCGHQPLLGNAGPAKKAKAGKTAPPPITPRPKGKAAKESAKTPVVATQVTSRKNDSACLKLTCDFESTMCGYADANGRLGNRAAHLLHGRIRIQNTSVQGAAKGKSYIGAVLRPGDTVALEATDLVIPDNRVLRFQVFESAANTTVKMCLDSATNCPYSISQGATHADGVWQTARIKIPAKTHTVYFIAENKGAGTGAFGLDNVALISAASGDNSHC